MAYHASHINSILAAREETFPTAQDMLGTILVTFLLLVLPLGHQTITPFRYRPFSCDKAVTVFQIFLKQIHKWRFFVYSCHFVLQL